MKRAVFLLTVFFCVSAVQAQEVEKKDRAQDPSPAVSAAKLAAELAGYGYRNKSALSLANAAQIIAQHPFRELTPEKSESEGSGSAAGAVKENETPELEFDRLIADARTLAGGDKSMLALVDQVAKSGAAEAEASKGRKAGPAAVSRRVEAQSSYVDYVTFVKGELAEVAISGDGDTDLDLYVYDENGNLIDSDADYTDDCYVSFLPKWTGAFKILVKNRGHVYNRYVLLVN
ncbi:MAG: hypothetical protein LBJ01_10515 [Tannerella sp.]|jgi:hypothetical protein|nr:hypothetical protein [Tannerella sp.]